MNDSGPRTPPIGSTNRTLCYLPLEIGGADSGAQVKSIDSTYLAIGASWLVLGMVLGIVMGASENFLFMPVHAHINLVGFACHSIFGMAYRQWPAMKASSLAPYQFWIFVIATPITLIGLAFTLTGGPALPTIIGSLGVLIGAALFCFLIWRTLLVAAD
jgi:hypothetical protein